MTRFRIAAICLIATAAALCLPGRLPAQALPGIGAAPAPAESPAATGEASSPTTDVQQVDPKLQRMLATPRQALQKFMEAVEEKRLGEAARALDVSGLPPERAAELATRLKTVIDRMVKGSIDYDAIPDPDELDGSWRLLDLESVATTDALRIELVQEEDGLWRFSPSTVAEIPELYDRWKDSGAADDAQRADEVQTFSMWLEDQFQPHLHETYFLLPSYQWICLLVIILLGFLADWLVRLVLWYSTSLWIKYVLRHTELDFDTKLWRPVGLLVQVLIWYAGLRLFLPDWGLLTDLVIFVALKLFTVIAAVWTGFIFVNLFSAFLAKKAARTATKFDDLLVPLLSRSLKVLIVGVGIVSAAQVFNLPLAGVLAGLGIGGLALGLAAQDTIKNFFGTVMIFTDRPFELGDRIVVDGHDGPVEMVGFRSTCIRTLEGNLVTIPNGELASKTILNIGKRPGIRRMMNLTITYDTPPDKVRRAVSIVREILENHEGMDPEFPPRVYFNEFNADSLNIWVIYWYHPADWWRYCEFSERLNFEILRRYEAEGIEFAFPTRTLYLAGDPKRPLAPFESEMTRNGEPAQAGR